MWAVPYIWLSEVVSPKSYYRPAAREGEVNLNMYPPSVNGSDVYVLEEGS